MQSGTKQPRAKVPATNAARRLREKLAALVARPGTADEGKAARHKLTRLEARYDFGQVDVSKEYLFTGQYSRDCNARPIMSEIRDMDLATWVKWAIEEATGITCLFRAGELCAHATEKTAGKLQDIGRVIAGGFTELWARFETFPHVTQDDRSIFLRGLWDGMMEQRSVGQALPQRAHVQKIGRAKKRAVGQVAGIALHPYAVAVELGKQIRFNAPLPEVENQLEAMRPKELTQ